MPYYNDKGEYVDFLGQPVPIAGPGMAQPVAPAQVIDAVEPTLVPNEEPLVPDAVSGDIAAPADSQIIDGEEPTLVPTEEESIPQAAPAQQLTRVPGARRGRIVPGAAERNAAVGIQGVKDARSDMAQAEAANTAALRAKNAQEAEYKEELARIDTKHQAELEKIQADRAQRSQARLTAVETAMNEAASMTTRPGRLWNSSIGGQMAGMFSAFMGGFLGARGVQNNIQQIIDNGIARDIAAQESDKRTAQQGILNKLKLNDLYSEEEDRKYTEEKMNRIARRTNLVTEMQAQILRMKDPILVAEGQKAIAAQKLALAKEFEEYRQFEVNVADREAARQVQQIEGARNRAVQRARIAASRRANALKAQENALNFKLKFGEASFNPKSTGVSTKDGGTAFVFDKELRKEVRSKVNGANMAVNAIDYALENIDFGRLARGKSLSGDDLVQARQFLAIMKRIGLGGESLGRTTDKDMELISDAAGVTGTGDELRFTGSAKGIEKALKRYKANAVAEANTALSQGLSDHQGNPVVGTFNPVEDVDFQKQMNLEFKDNSGAAPLTDQFNPGRLKKLSVNELTSLIQENDFSQFGAKEVAKGGFSPEQAKKFAEAARKPGTLQGGKEHQKLLVNALNELEQRKVNTLPLQFADPFLQAAADTVREQTNRSVGSRMTLDELRYRLYEETNNPQFLGRTARQQRAAAKIGQEAARRLRNFKESRRIQGLTDDEIISESVGQGPIDR